MTFEQMEKLTAKQRKKFFDDCKKFKEGQSLEDYKQDIRDYIVLYEFFEEGRKIYTIDFANQEIDRNRNIIPQLYDEKMPVGEAVIEVEFACG